MDGLTCPRRCPVNIRHLGPAPQVWCPRYIYLRGQVQVSVLPGLPTATAVCHLVKTSKLWYCFHFILFYEKILFIFKERRREGERDERNTNV